MLLAVPLLAGGVVVAVLAGSLAWAIVGLNLAILAAFGWVVLWARGLQANITGLRRSSTAAGKEIAGLRGALGDLHASQKQTATHAAWIRRQLADDGRVILHLSKLYERIVADGKRTSEQMQGGFVGVGREFQRTNATLQSMPGTTVELSRRYRQLVPHDRLMPAADGRWALTARTLVWLLDQVASGEVSTVLECGSGTSTVWFAAAFEARGDGHVFALESDPAFAEQTRTHLETIGLSHRADVIDAPLVDSAVNGREPRPWYDLSGLPDAASDIDLLFVDGPVGTLAPEARYPAFPQLAARLAENAIVVLDDTNRPDEASIVEAWLVEEHASRRLERIGSTDRATALRVLPSQSTDDTQLPA